MELLFLLVLAAIAGYYLAGLRPEDKRQTQAQPRRGLFGRRKDRTAFRTWALGAGASFFPEDFKAWLAGLSPTEAEEFQASLDNYATGLGYRLRDLSEGKMDNRARMQVFVEAIVVYSQEYRKLKEAQKKAQKENEKEGDADGRAAEKQVAEKRASRRKRREPNANGEHNIDASESAAAA